MKVTILHAFPFSAALVSLCGCSIISDRMSEQERAFQRKQAQLEAKLHQKDKVVYAVRYIPQGTAILSDALEEREVPISRIPFDALTSSSLCIGRKARYPIGAGQIVGQFDLAPMTDKDKQSAKEEQE